MYRLMTTFDYRHSAPRTTFGAVGNTRESLRTSRDATAIDEPIRKAVTQDCFLANAIPLPAEVDESIAFISETPQGELRSFWNSQLRRVTDYGDLTKGIQRIWDNAAHPEIKPHTGRMKSISISALLDNYDVVGARLDVAIRLRLPPWWAAFFKKGRTIAIPP